MNIASLKMQTILVVLKAERSNATTKSEKEVANNCRTKGSEEDDSGSSNGIGVSDEMQTLVFDSQCDPIVNGGEHHYVQRGREHKADDKGIGHEIICNKTNKKCMIKFNMLFWAKIEQNFPYIHINCQMQGN